MSKSHVAKERIDRARPRIGGLAGFLCVSTAIALAIAVGAIGCAPEDAESAGLETATKQEAIAHAPQYTGEDLYLVKLVDSDDDSDTFCSGALLTNEWVLTAEHCFNPPYWAGHTLSDTIFEYKGQQISGDGALKEGHPTGVDADVALVKLPEPFRINDSCTDYHPHYLRMHEGGCLDFVPPPFTINGPEMTCYGYGWDEDEHSGVLRYADFQITNYCCPEPGPCNHCTWASAGCEDPLLPGHINPSCCDPWGFHPDNDLTYQGLPMWTLVHGSYPQPYLWNEDSGAPCFIDDKIVAVTTNHIEDTGAGPFNIGFGVSGLRSWVFDTIEDCDFSSGNPDLDGVAGDVDNCPCNYNPNQRDCDGDGRGDVCDKTPCANFDDYGILDLVPLGSNIFLIGWGTPNPMQITYRPASAAHDHEAHLKWCDCEDLSDEACKSLNCPRDDDLPLQFAQNYEHGGWHLASLNSYDGLETEQAVSGDQHLLRVDCDTGSTWSDEIVDAETGLTTRHCSPDVIDYYDWDQHSRYWDWKGELWWESTVGSFQLKHAPAHVHMWLRPEMDECVPAGVEDVGFGGLNKYFKASMMEQFWKVNPIIKYKMPHWFDDFPSRDLVNPVGSPLVEAAIPQLHRPHVIIVMVPEDASADIGKFAFGELANPGSDVGGMFMLLVDQYNLEVGEVAYGTASAAGGLPDTTGFASARFDRGFIPQIMAQGDFPVPRRGIAVFGGTTNGTDLTNDLRFAEFGGLDPEGTPYYRWTLAVPSSKDLPLPRKDAGMVYEPFGRRLLMFGGELSDGEAAGDLWAYDLLEGVWTQLTPEEQLPALTNFAVVHADRKVYVVGGIGAGGVPSTAVYRFDPTELTLETVGDLADGPGARTRIAATFDDAGDGKILVFGGYGADEVGHADAWELDLGDGSWSLRNAECTGRHCPSPSEYPILVARPASGGQSAEVAVFPSDDLKDVLHYKARPGEPWRNDLDPGLSPCDDAEAWQPGTGLCWNRCPVGQAWNGWECEGDVESVDWYDATTACDGEHGLPTKAELEDLLGGCEDYWLFELCEPCSTETACGDVLDEESTDCLLGKRRYWSSTGQGSWQWWAWAWWGNLADGIIAPARKHRELGMKARCMRELWELEL